MINQLSVNPLIFHCCKIANLRYSLIMGGSTKKDDQVYLINTVFLMTMYFNMHIDSSPGACLSPNSYLVCIIYYINVVVVTYLILIRINFILALWTSYWSLPAVMYYYIHNPVWQLQFCLGFMLNKAFIPFSATHTHCII